MVTVLPTSEAALIVAVPVTAAPVRPTPETVTCRPTSAAVRPWAAVVVIVTRLPDSVAPVGVAATAKFAATVEVAAAGIVTGVVAGTITAVPVPDATRPEAGLV